VRLRLGAAPYAGIGYSGAHVRVAIPRGGANLGARVEASSSGLTIRGVAHSEDVHLFLAQPMVLSGFVVPRHDAAFEWEQGLDGKLVTQLSLESSTEDVGWGVSPDTLWRVELPCSSFALAASELDLSTVLPDAPPTRAEAAFMPERDIRLRPEPSAEPVATVHVERNRSPLVVAHESRDGFTHVKVGYGTYWLVGWVPSDDIDTRGKPGSFAPRKVRGQRPKRRSAGWRCPHDLTLIGRLGEIEGPVGTLAAHSPFEWSNVDARPQARLPQFPWFTPLRGAVTLVDEAALNGCTKE